MKSCAVCHSTLQILEGDWNRYGFPVQLPIIRGHEILGIVKGIDKRVKTVKIGDRIGIQPLY